jgi:hypothetical protein
VFKLLLHKKAEKEQKLLKGCAACFEAKAIFGLDLP